MTFPVAPPPQQPRARLRGWVRTAGSKLPTKWFASIGTAFFLAATAAFGGLNPVPPEEIAHLKSGETFNNDLYSITVDKAFIFDELTGSGAHPEEGEQVLALRVEATNLWYRPEWGSGSGSLPQSVIVDNPRAEYAAIARIDDSTTSPRLQPGIPSPIVLTWTIPRGSISDGDTVRIILNNVTLSEGQFITTGESWGDFTPAATMDLVAEYRPSEEE